MTVRRLLTDRYLRALPPAPPGQRVEVYDARLPGFGVRVSDAKDADPSRRGKAARITFVLYCRFSPGAAATRRAIGVYPTITLEEARRIAGEWRSLVARGVDPAVIEAERRAVEARARALRVRHSFTVVAEQFIRDKLSKERAGKIAERILRNTFVTAWAEKPVIEISTLDVLEVISATKARAPKMAGAQLTLLKRFFAWVADQQIFGLPSSPCDRLKVKTFAGEMRSRDRRLNDAEIFAFMRASQRMRYPVGPLLPHFVALRIAAARGRRAVVARTPRRHHRHSRSADEGTPKQGRRTSGADHRGAAGGHRGPAAHQERQVPVQPQGRGIAADGDRRDEGHHRQAHDADPEGNGPPSRRGLSGSRAAAIRHPRPAKNDPFRSGGIGDRGQRR